MSSREETVLEALIESELAASESYRLIVESLGKGSHLGELRRIESEHRQAAGVLRERCRGAAPTAASAWAPWTGASGAGWARAGEAFAAVSALKAGEENEIREYEAALENPAVGDDSKRLIASMLLPQTRAHLQMLDRYARLTRG